MKLFTPVAALVASCGLALSLAGCAGGATGTDPAHERLAVVATTTQVGDFTAEVGGNDISLTTLLAPGASAHHFDPSPADLLALGKADVLIESGAGLEGFVDGAVASSGFSGALVTAADGVDIAEAKTITAGGGGYVDDEGAPGAPPSDLNPHLWTSPTFAKGMVEQIASGLAQADPAHADGYRQRADAYIAKLTALDSWIAAQFDRVPAADREFVSGHDAMRYYLHDYGIQYVGSLLPSFEDNAEPSAAQIDELIAAIKAHGVRAIFTESSISPKLAETVAQETGATWVSGDNALYVDALGAAGSGAETYLGAMIHNTNTILEAWGVTPDPLPAELEGS